MKNSKFNYAQTVLAFLFIITVFGCSKKLDRYEDPPWLGGTSIETLEKNGNYTIFLKLMEKAGYRNTVEKQLTTLFAPDDAAFANYFTKRGISSVDDLSEDQALELFTLHFLSNPINANHLVYEKAWNRLESATGEYRSLFFRKPTKSISAPYKEIPKYDPTYKGKELYIYTDIKYLPLFSKYYFLDYNGDGNVDYPLMYPESNWGGLLQWHNARILPQAGKENTTEIEDLASPTASGFIYYLDQVVDAMPNIEQYLIANQDKYSLFYDLLQRYATYTESTIIDKQGRKLYTKGYSNISNIASEEGPSADQPACMLNIYTVFLPDDSVLQTYLKNTILKTYANIDEVPDVTVRYILQTQITNRLELKSKFTKVFYNVYGEKSVLDADIVESGYMCSNGVIYKTKRVLEPNIFECVPGKLFFDKNYSAFLTLLTFTNMITSLSGERIVTLFAPTNDQLLASNIRLYQNSAGSLEFQQKGDDGQWKKMSITDMIVYAQDHVYNGKITDLSGSGYLEMYSHNYIHYSNGVLQGGLNILKGISAKVVDENVSKNGMLYFIDQPVETKYRMGQYILSDPDLSEFANLMVKTNMLDLAFVESETKYKYPNIAVTEASGAYYWTAFLPNNTSITNGFANGSIPDTAVSDISDPDHDAKLTALKNFVNYHFVQKTIFDDGVLSGTFNTLYTGTTLTIANSLNNLTVTDVSGQVVTVNHTDANHLVRRGVVHKITSILKNQ